MTRMELDGCMSKEKTIQDAVLSHINNLKHCVAENVHGNAFTGAGRPDINASIHGRSVRIELKTADHGNKADPAQVLNLQMWAHTGALCFVAYSLADVKVGLDCFIVGGRTYCSNCELAKKGLCYSAKRQE